VSPKQSGAICLAVYRPDPGLLRVQLKSIAAQTLTDWTCTIGIDGRDPSAVRQIRDVVGTDARFVVCEFPDRRGFYRNFERILTEVNPDAGWVALADQDDYWYPGKLETMVPALDSHALVAGQARIVDLRGGGTAAVESFTDRAMHGLGPLSIDNCITGSLSVMRASLLRLALPFPEPTDAAYHDHWLALCADVDGGIRILTDVVQDYQQHEANVIGEELGRSAASRFAKLRGASGGGLGPQLDYLAQHRFGWRARMCRVVLERATIPEPQRRTLEAFASQSASLELARIVIRAVVAHHSPPARSLAILAGSIWAGRTRRIHK
jgi:Glycosyl transferase family 2